MGATGCTRGDRGGEEKSVVVAVVVMGVVVVEGVALRHLSSLPSPCVGLVFGCCRGVPFSCIMCCVGTCVAEAAGKSDGPLSIPQAVSEWWCTSAMVAEVAKEEVTCSLSYLSSAVTGSTTEGDSHGPVKCSLLITVSSSFFSSRLLVKDDSASET